MSEIEHSPSFVEIIGADRIKERRLRDIGGFADIFSKDGLNSAQTTSRLQQALCFGKADERASGKTRRETKKKTEAENALMGYLFAVARSRVPPEIFDAAKETRQIEAAFELLNGNHVHVGTGEGKSSVILPIVSIVEAITSPQKRSILASVNDILVSDLNSYTSDYINQLNQVLPPAAQVQLEVAPTPHSPNSTLPSQILQERLTRGELLETTKEDLRDDYWEKVVETKSGVDFLKESPTRPKVMIFNERTLVFTYLEDPTFFAERSPTIFFDEAHVPYDRQSPYEVTKNEAYATMEDILDSACNWLRLYLLTGKIKERDVVFSNGEYQLTPEAEDRIVGLDYLTIKKDDRDFNRGAKIIFDALRRTEGLPEGLTLHPQRFLSFRNTLLGAFKERLLPRSELAHPQEELAQQDENLGLAQVVAGFRGKLGVNYLLREDAQGIEVRDMYLGTLMAEHEYQPLNQLAILALNNQYQFVPLAKKASETTHFQTFVYDLRDKVRCASGSMLFPDPMTGKPIETPFASLLHRATKKDIVLISPPEFKKAPTPLFFITDEAAITALTEDAKKDINPQLVVCWNEEEASAIVERMKETLGEEAVGLVTARTKTDEEKELYRALADGRIRAVVSSGKSGIGVNIVDSNQHFPNLKVSLFNLPMTRLQITQALGRRRVTGDNFSWYIADNSLARVVSFLDSKRNITKGFDKKKALDMMEQTKTNPEARLKLALNLINSAERAMMAEDDFVIYSDLGYRKFYRPLAMDYLQRRIIEDQGSVPWLLNEEGKIDNSKLRVYLEIFGLPASLYADIGLRINMIWDASGIKDMIENKLVQKLVGKEGDFPAIMESWYRARKDSAQDIASIYYDNGTIRAVAGIAYAEALPIMPVGTENYRVARFDGQTEVQPGLKFGYITYKGESDEELRFFGLMADGPGKRLLIGGLKQDSGGIIPFPIADNAIKTITEGKLAIRSMPRDENSHLLYFSY